MHGKSGESQRCVKLPRRERKGRAVRGAPRCGRSVGVAWSSLSVCVNVGFRETIRRDFFRDMQPEAVSTRLKAAGYFWVKRKTQRSREQQKEKRAWTLQLLVADGLSDCCCDAEKADLN